MKYRLFYVRHWLTPAMQEKVRKERSESPDATPEIRYKRKKVVEDREFDDFEDMTSWVYNQSKFMEDIPTVKNSYLDLWGFIANPTPKEATKMAVVFLEHQQVDLPL